VLLYIDGQLEPAACKTVRTVNTDTSGAAAQRVAFGKNSAIRHASDPRPVSHTFRGCMDEVTLCAGALSGEEIRSLMHGRMPAEPPG
jgi:hypothetical protein